MTIENEWTRQIADLEYKIGVAKEHIEDQAVRNLEIHAKHADLLAAVTRYAENWLHDEYESAELCMSPYHHSEVVALFDAMDRAKSRGNV
jgi:hypothetical protein